LSGADAQVVAWEAEDEDLKSAFRNGLNVHNHNGTAVWGAAYKPESKPRKFTMRDELKRAVHGTNYGVTSRSLGITLSWTTAMAESFRARWLMLHPGIANWQRRINHDLMVKRTTTNAFGYRIVWFDRPESCYNKALAWGPQSTVSIVCAKGGVSLYENLPWVQVLLQVHDSLVFQIPFHRMSPSGLDAIRRTLRIEVPYSDPLTIPWGLAISEKSWGDVAKVEWNTAEMENAG
jgi:DNA polymerase I-like protein with 3'-5' exonuclease and polymerase domains